MASQLIFGTALFGRDWTEFQDTDSVKKVLETLQTLRIHRLDTGARYPPFKQGFSEELIGNAKELSSNFVVNTKIYSGTRKNGSGDLNREAMQKLVAGSLQRLQRPEGVRI